MKFTFDKEKVKKECEKIIRIANLGEKTLSGYKQNQGFSLNERNVDFTLIEMVFIEQVYLFLMNPEFSKEKVASIRVILDSIFADKNAMSSVDFREYLLFTYGPKEINLEEIKNNFSELYNFLSHDISVLAPYFEDLDYAFSKGRCFLGHYFSDFDRFYNFYFMADAFYRKEDSVYDSFVECLILWFKTIFFDCVGSDENMKHKYSEDSINWLLFCIMAQSYFINEIIDNRFNFCKPMKVKAV